MIDAPEVRFLRTRLLVSLSLVGGVVVAGTVGYAWLWRAEGATWLDAL